MNQRLKLGTPAPFYHLSMTRLRGNRPFQFPTLPAETDKVMTPVNLFIYLFSLNKCNNNNNKQIKWREKRKSDALSASRRRARRPSAGASQASPSDRAGACAVYAVLGKTHGLRSHFPSGLATKSPNFAVATKTVFPKSFKFRNSGSEPGGFHLIPL